LIWYGNIIFMTGFQKRTPETLRGRLFGAVGTVAMALMPIGTAVGRGVNTNRPQLQYYFTVEDRFPASLRPATLGHP
jgi:hypothetical protein